MSQRAAEPGAWLKPGTLPSGWAWTTLGEIAETIRGVTYRKAEAANEPGEGRLPLLRATNIVDGVLNLDSELVYVPSSRVSDTQILASGDIVIAASSGSTAVVGKSAPVRNEWLGTFGAFCAVARPRTGVDALYVAHFVASQTVRRRWSRLATGTNINNLKREHFTDTPVPLPPLNEQRRIVAAIEEHLSRLDAADASLAASVRQLDVLRRSALGAAVNGGWARRPLGEVAQTQLGKMLSRKSKTGVGSRPYLRNKNVQWGRIDTDDLLTMDFTESEAEKFGLTPGDVLVCEGGEVGRAAVWRGQVEGCCFQKALHRVRSNGEVLPEFIAHVLRWLADTNAFDPYVTGSTIKHLPQEDLRLIPVPVPPVEEQRRIVAEVEARLSTIDAMRASIANAQRRSTALRAAILERAFSGELVPQDPADEPAEALLARIRDERSIRPGQRHNGAVA